VSCSPAAGRVLHHANDDFHVSVSELHTHPGEEAFYVLKGATLETPDGNPLPDNWGVEDQRP